MEDLDRIKKIVENHHECFNNVKFAFETVDEKISILDEKISHRAPVHFCIVRGMENFITSKIDLSASSVEDLTILLGLANTWLKDDKEMGGV